MHILNIKYNQSTDFSNNVIANLTILNLRDDLTSLPEKIGNLVKLKYLNLHVNKLHSLPKSIGNLTNLDKWDLGDNRLTYLPDSVGNLVKLRYLDIQSNQLTSLPENIGNLTNLDEFYLRYNQLTHLPESIGDITKLRDLYLGHNRLTHLPDNIDRLSMLSTLDLSNNKLSTMPDIIGKLSRLSTLDLSNNQLISLPESIASLYSLQSLSLNGNPIVDLSILQRLPNLKTVRFLSVILPRRYWTKLDNWKAEWIFSEENAEIKRILIEQIGYEKICENLDVFPVDTWQEYTLIRIDGVEKVRVNNGGVRSTGLDDDDDDDDDFEFKQWIEYAPMLLLKMTCPSTAHIHILRVPPNMLSAEAAITWVNHGIHPDKFAVQT